MAGFVVLGRYLNWFCECSESLYFSVVTFIKTLLRIGQRAMRLVLLVALALVGAILLVNAQPPKSNKPIKALICLTYDDGLESHLLTVLPQLDSAGLKATFFLNSIQGASNVVGEVSKAVSGWSQAASKGHELANHTLFHPCPMKLGFARAFAIDNYTVDKIEKEIATQNSLLALIDPKRKVRSFAFPCNNVFVGQTDYSRIIYEKGLVKYGRIGGDRTSIITDFKNTHPMHVPSWFVEEGTTLNELIAFAENVRKNGRMGVYQFHGVGGEFFKISRETHRAFLDYLNQHADVYLVTTFSEAMASMLKK
jgi:peptidoglycan/xylan/chitin deacetylase (PgdA/CDA1 family)